MVSEGEKVTITCPGETLTSSFYDKQMPAEYDVEIVKIGEI